LPNILVALIALGGAGAAIWFLPNRTAAVILGILAGVALTYLVIQKWHRTTQIAIFWLSAGVVADAAYAKLNDQAPVTIASLLVKFGESIVKLADILIRSMGVAGPDLRVKMAAVTPDFVWALILVTTLLMAIGLAGRQGASAAAKPELRRAA
jgi:hypothetical protein